MKKIKRRRNTRSIPIKIQGRTTEVQIKKKETRADEEEGEAERRTRR